MIDENDSCSMASSYFHFVGIKSYKSQWVVYTYELFSDREHRGLINSTDSMKLDIFYPK